MKIKKPIADIHKGLDITKRVAATKQKDPLLTVVLIDLAEPTNKGIISSMVYGFYTPKRRLILGNLVNAVWVKIDNKSCNVEILSYGKYSSKGIKQITDFGGQDAFPQSPLDLDHVSFGTDDILHLLLNHPVSKKLAIDELGDIKLSLKIYKNKPVWIVQQEVPNVGYRGMIISAHDGDIVSEKTDWLYGNEK